MKFEECLIALDSGKRKQKRAALDRLFVMAQKGQGKDAIPTLKKLLDSDDNELRLLALNVIVRLDKKGHIELLKSLLNDADPQMRGFCASILGSSGNKAIAYPVIRALLRSPTRLDNQFGKLFSDMVPADFDLEKLSPDELRGGDASIDDDSAETTERHVSTKFCDDELTVEIQRCVGENAPTPLQLQILKVIEQLPKKITTRVRKELQRRLEEIDPDYDGEPLDLTFLNAVIPPLKTSAITYFFLYGDSDFDIEHGFACLFRNGKDFCICEPDLLHDKFETDDVSVFEKIFQRETVVSLE